MLQYSQFTEILFTECHLAFDYLNETNDSLEIKAFFTGIVEIETVSWLDLLEHFRSLYKNMYKVFILNKSGLPNVGN